jgi:hypothetical protein
MGKWFRKHWRWITLLVAGGVAGAAADHTVGDKVAKAVVQVVTQIPATPGEAPLPTAAE